MTRPEPINKEQILSDNEFIVSKTDKRGKIIYGNKVFIKYSKYSEDELLGAPHSILRHPDMPKIVFKLLWDRLHDNKEIFAYVKNLSKDGDFYWVYTNVTITLDENGNFRDYHSVRRKPNPKAIEVIEPIYKQMIEAEKTGGMDASYKLLVDTLNSLKVDYDTLIFNLQNS